MSYRNNIALWGRALKMADAVYTQLSDVENIMEYRNFFLKFKIYKYRKFFLQG